MKHIVKVGESLFAIASKYGLTVSELRQLNPLISSNLRIGQELIVEKSAMEASHVDVPPTPKIAAISDQIHTYIVQAGDTLFGIAQRYRVTVAEIMQANRLDNARLAIGQRLRIPSPVAPPKPVEIVMPEVHVVGKGDTWYGIAQKYKLSLQDLKAWNAASNDLLREGQKVRLKAPLFVPPIKEEKDDLPKDDAPSEKPMDVNTQMRLYSEARKQFILTIHNGIDTFGEGLRSAVGRNHINRPEDLNKIQVRLVELGILAEEHGESPEELYKEYGRGALTANLIPKTVEAIEHFQNKFRVRFWIEHSSRVAMLKTNSFTQGVIMPDDITYKVLREYTQYRLTFTHPQDGLLTTVKFYNFPLSNYTQYYQGVSYIGNSNPDIPLSVFQRLGVNGELAHALQYVSKNEGHFDALNTYDSAVFSYGFIQFAGNGGSFAQLLAHIKHKAPKLFQDFFQIYGVDVDYILHQNTIRQAKLLLANPYDKGGKFWLEGLEAEMALREDKQLYGIFIRAGYHLPIITLQIDAAIRYYVVPALQIGVNIRVGSQSLADVPITQIANSPMVLALLIDTVVNQWINRTQDIFRQAFENLINQRKLQSLSELRQLDERKIVEQIITDAKQKNDIRLVQRATNMLQSGLSTQKTTTPLFV